MSTHTHIQISFPAFVFLLPSHAKNPIKREGGNEGGKNWIPAFAFCWGFAEGRKAGILKTVIAKTGECLFHPPSPPQCMVPLMAGGAHHHGVEQASIMVATNVVQFQVLRRPAAFAPIAGDVKGCLSDRLRELTSRHSMQSCCGACCGKAQSQVPSNTPFSLNTTTPIFCLAYLS